MTDRPAKTPAKKVARKRAAKRSEAVIPNISAEKLRVGPVEEGQTEVKDDQVLTDTPEPDDPATQPTVSAYPQGWHLVEHGTWQVSVAPDGLVMLPRHLHPDEIEDFCKAAMAAADVGSSIRAANAEKHVEVTEDDIAALDDKAIVEHTEVAQAAAPTPGIVKMMVQQRVDPGRAQQGTIGQRDPRQPRSNQPPQLPIPGARHGRS